MEVFNFQAVHERRGWGREREDVAQDPSVLFMLALWIPPDVFGLRSKPGQFQFGVQKLTADHIGVHL